jgi:hypothetical protein
LITLENPLNKTAKRLLAIVPFLFLLACSTSSDADQFVGSWHKVELPTETAHITRNGGDFLIERNGSSMFGMDPNKSSSKTAATLVDGKLAMNAFENATLIKESGRLLIGRTEYAKDK